MLRQLLFITVFTALTLLLLSDARNILKNSKDGNIAKPESRISIELNNETFFFALNDPSSWNESNTKCNLLGMQLVTVDTSERWSMISDWLLANPDYDYWYWTSGQKPAGQESFVWTTNGDNFTFTQWNVGQPSIKEDEESCMNIFAGTGGWDDDICSYYLAYICEPQKL